ncbi:MAG: hypothetical protein RLZZ35_777, partial [Actinomycetota bacterium]
MNSPQPLKHERFKLITFNSVWQLLSFWQVRGLGDYQVLLFGGLPGLAVSVAIALIANLFLVLLRGTEGFIKNATASAFALLYPGFVAGFIFLLARSGEGFSYIATLVILVGCNDTFAYVFGVLLGKHPLAPKISPKKTWEGFVGGLIFTSIGSALAFYYLLDHHPAIGALAGFAGVLAATVGDLV